MQWCFVTESLRDSIHDKGAHGYGGIWGGLGASFHHNLLAHHDSRNARLNGARYHGTDGETVDMRNNVIYNWRGNSTYGGEPTGTGVSSHQNLINNYYKSGPATGSGSFRYRVLNPSSNAGFYGLFHVAGNHTSASSTVSADNWNGGVQGPSSSQLTAMRVNSPFDVAPVMTQTASSAFPLVLAYGGCRTPNRDSVDTRIAAEVANGTVTHYGSKNNLPGIIDSQTDVGGWPTLVSSPAPADGDADGMPDAWENAHGLDPSNAADRNIINADGYTNLDIYLNELAASAFPVPVIGSQPESQTLTAGAGFSVSVMATGIGPFTYQWFHGESLILDATDANYTTVTTTPADVGDYSVIVTNGYGSTRSEAATINLGTLPPVIDAGPASLSVEVGQVVMLSISTSGTLPISWQWYRGDRAIAGATGETLDLGPVDLTAAGPYRVVASNPHGSASSESAVLTVKSVSETALFDTSFSSDTIHAGSPVVNATRTNWYVMSSKNATGSSVNSSSGLDLTMTSTSSGIIDTGARFSNTPVTLGPVGSSLRLRAEVTTSNVRTLGIGLFDSGGTLPYTGMNNGQLSNSSSTLATGGTQAWNGLRFNLDINAALPAITLEGRPAQPGTTNSSQSLIAAGTSSSAPTVNLIGSGNVPGFAWSDNATYTLTLDLSRSAADAITLTATLHSGTDTAASALGSATETVTGAGFPASFDSMGIGFRNRDASTVPHLRIKQVTVSQVQALATVSNPYQAFRYINDLDPVTTGLPEFDFESDGVPNALEFILGGDPKGSSPAVLPTLVDESGWVLRFLKHIDTSSAFDLVVEGSTGLLDWEPLVNGMDGVVITDSTFSATHDQVEVRLPSSPGSARFVRLSATPRPVE